MKGGEKMPKETDCAYVSQKEAVEKYFNTVYRLAFSQTKNKSDAEDVTQDVFLRFMQKNDGWRGEEHMKAWLLRVTINRCHDHFTSSWRKRTEPLTDDIPFSSPEKSDVYYATASLPPKYRAVIHLFYYEDMSVAEIAKSLGIKETTVKTQLHRGREMIKSRLKGEYDFV